jgi:chitinase
MDDYKVLRALPGYTSHRDPVTKQMWIFNGSTFWTFDDAQVMADKGAYIRSQGLGGAMIWSMDGDTSNGELMTALDTALR